MKNRFILPGIALAIIAGAAILGLHAYRQLQSLEGYRDKIVAYAREALDRDVQYGAARLTFGPGPALTFEKVVIAEKDRRESFATAAEISLRVALLPYLLDKKLILSEIRLADPRLLISRDEQGTWNIADLFVAKKPLPVELGGITVKGGEVTLRDRMVKTAPLIISDVNFHLDRWERGQTTRFDIEAAVGQGKAGRISLEGKAQLARDREELRQSSGEVKLRIKDLDLALPWPWLRPRIPLEKLAGNLTADLQVNGRQDDFSAAGSLEIKQGQCIYPKVFPVNLNPSNLRFTYELKKTPAALTLNRAELALDGMKFQGSMTIKEPGGSDPAWEVKVAGGNLDLERHGKYLPYGIMPAATADFIRKHIRAGVFQLPGATLKGRRSDFRNWGAVNRESIADIQVTVTGGILAFGTDTPLFNDIKGQLVFLEREIRFQNMTANFGDAPLVLNGKIENYALDAPATYPFTAAIQPTRKELAWLLGSRALEKLSFTGKTNMTLGGNGPAAAYELRGEWNLAEAAYRYGDWLVKPAGMANTAGFSVKIDSRGLNFHAGRYTLPPLDIGWTAFFPFAGSRGSARIETRTNNVSLEAMRSCSPVLAKHEAAGGLQGNASAVQKGKSPEDYLWQGNISLLKAAFKIPESGKTIRELSGPIHWEGEKLSSPGLSGSYGKTPFTVAGTLTGFDKPAYEGTFAVPYFHAEDLPLREFPSGDSFREVRGAVSYNRETLRVRELTFRYQGGRGAAAGETQLAAAGGQPSHHYRFSLSGIAVAGLFREKENDQVVTGALSGSGEIIISGKTAADFKKTASGSMSLKIEKGVLKKFPVLAKIFSLLNISQLLRLKLPDLATEGMTFRTISADITMKNGLAATNNLYLDSDAMNIVGTGKINLAERTIDATIGLQPLQTVDKIISRIPVAGWILTDDDRRFITVYFDARGSLDNPSVRAIPIKGLSEEALDMFKRVFKLPKKLVTDTGEIIY